MQALDHRLELAERARRRVAHLGREEADRVVAPVVAQAELDQALVVDERVHRQQLDRGDAEALQVIDHRRAGESRVRAAQLLRNVGMQLRQPLDVRLVDHRVLPAAMRGGRSSPQVKAESTTRLFGHAARVVARVERQVLAPAADAIAEMRVGPAQRTLDHACVRIEQQLVRVEAMAALGRVRAVHAIAVEQAGPRFGQVAVPDEVGALRHVDPLDLAPALRVEQAKLDALGVLGIQREVDAGAVPGRAERRGRTAPDVPGAPAAVATSAASPSTHAREWRRAEWRSSPGGCASS